MKTSTLDDSLSAGIASLNGLQSDQAIGELQQRIKDLLEDNDDMRLQLWTKDVVIHVLAERIRTLEGLE